jgi:predicted aconitase
MSLEDVTAENTAALKELTAAIKAMGGKTPAAATGTTPGKPGRPAKVAVTLEQVKAMAEKVVEVKDKPTAVALIRQFGAPNLAGLDESKYSQFIAAAELVIQQAEEPAAEEGAGEDEL